MGSTPIHGTMKFKVGDIISYKKEPYIASYGVGIVLQEPSNMLLGINGKGLFFAQVYWFTRKERRNINTNLLKKIC